jgi:hypothetical protein
MKRDWLLQRVPRITATVILAVVLLACATVVNAAEEKQEEKQGDQWRFAITPYIWVPGISGTLKYGSGNDRNVSLSQSDYLSNLQFVGFLDLQAEKGRWSLLVDLMYLDFSNDDRSVVLPGGLYVGAETKLSAFIGEAVVGYAVYRTKDVDFSVIGGVRYADVDGELTLNVAGQLPAGFSAKVSKRKSFIDPIVGFKGKFELGKNWYLPYYFDIGGFGVDSDLTLQAFAGIGYRFCDWFSMVLGYRYLYYNFGDTKLVNDLNLYGATLGFKFTF